MARTRRQKKLAMLENFECGIIVKLFIFFLVSSFVINTESKTSTACNGVSTLTCALHKLTCNSTTRISITGGHYGFRPGCGKTTNCSSTTTRLPDCCLPVQEYCVVAIDNSILSTTNTRCSSLTTPCTFAVKESKTSCRNLTVSAYSVIEYSCVSRTTTVPTTTTTKTTTTKRPTTQTTTTTTTTLSSTSTLDVSLPAITSGKSENSECVRAAVVGGVLGMIICILIILMVLGFLYFYRKIRLLSRKETGGYVLSHYSSTHRVSNTEEEKPAYDNLQRNQGDKAEAEKPAYDELRSPQPKDEERHYYNLDNVRRTPNPIYCNLDNGAQSNTKK